MVFASPRSYMLLSTAAAVATIVLKTMAWRLTGSVGLLSDAMESGVNLVAALGAIWALTLAAKPADRSHPYGHFKAEYFSSGLESVLIVVAAESVIVITKSVAAKPSKHSTSVLPRHFGSSRSRSEMLPSPCGLCSAMRL